MEPPLYPGRFNTEHRRAGRGELDGQRYAVQAPTHVDQVRGIFLHRDEVRPRRAHTVDEESYRGAFEYSIDPRRYVAIRLVQGRHTPRHFSGDAERLATGRQDAQIRTGR